MKTRPYLITICSEGDPLRTQDVEVKARNTWHARWLYHQLHPDAMLTAVRPVPDHRQ